MDAAEAAQWARVRRDLGMERLEPASLDDAGRRGAVTDMFATYLATVGGLLEPELRQGLAEELPEAKAHDVIAALEEVQEEALREEHVTAWLAAIGYRVEGPTLRYLLTNWEHANDPAVYLRGFRDHFTPITQGYDEVPREVNRGAEPQSRATRTSAVADVAAEDGPRRFNLGGRTQVSPSTTGPAPAEPRVNLGKPTPAPADPAHPHTEQQVASSSDATGSEPVQVREIEGSNFSGTSRSFVVSVDQAGATAASLRGLGGEVLVNAVAGLKESRITISTSDTSGPSAEAVQDATVRSAAGTLHVAVQGTGTETGGTTIIGGAVFNSGGSSVSGSVVTGRNISVVNGAVYADGRRVDNSGLRVGAAPVQVTIEVPKGSRLRAETDAADIRVTGELDEVSTQTVSGRTSISRAESVDSISMSGSVAVGAATIVRVNTVSGGADVSGEFVDVNTTSGRIRVRDFGGKQLNARTVSASIEAHIVAAGGRVRAGTVSGAIDITAAPGLTGLDVVTSTVSGRVRTPESVGSQSAPASRGERGFTPGGFGQGNSTVSINGNIFRF